MRRNKIGGRSQVVPILNGIPDHPARALGSREPFELHDGGPVYRFQRSWSAAAGVRRVPGRRLEAGGRRQDAMPRERLAEELGIRERVEFKGARGDVPEILAQTDVFVLASKTETLPISILEAMRAGLPVSRRM